MRVPLDFYRILGVPHQATPDQLQQAYRDRVQQLPRHHYSDGTITARKQLLEAAYTVLCDPEQRQDYDASFFTRVYAPSPSADPLAPESAEVEVSGIEIQDYQLAGALLLLQELGEYELVLKLGYPYLSSGILDLKYSRLGSVLSEADVVLSVALAYLELGREQWQQNQYERAAQSLKSGLDLLLREGLFSDVQNEIRTDLYKLRPYRILELLALPEDQDERSQGLRMLKDMLTERGSIDGTGNDQSGLGIDDFLQFVQQLRHYLTIAEQRELFETEARRPSKVATYLAVYTLLAQGFVQCQPALIRRAKTMLARLSNHQDVYLEQAVCALLLAQTEEVNQALELSQEYESIAFIRDYSEGSPDLIPGLCLYTERWLEDEVFPYFRDLADQQANLKAYFANQHVKAYLEALAAETPYGSIKDEGDTQPAFRISTPSSMAVDNQTPPSFASKDSQHWHIGDQPTPVRATPTQENRPWQSPYQSTRPGPNPNLEVNRSINPTDLNSDLSNGSMHSGIPTPPPAARVPQSQAKAQERRPRRWFGRVRERPSPPQEPQGTFYNGGSSGVKGPTSAKVRQRQFSTGGATHRPQVGQTSPHRPKRRSPSRRRHRAQLVGLILLSLLGVGALAAVAVSLIRRSQPAVSPEPQLPLVQLERPPVPIPTPDQPPTETSPNVGGAQSAPTPLTKEAVGQIIQTWQSTKAEALGPKHASNQLEQVLTEPVLSQWRTRAEAAKADDQYWQYKLNRLSVDGLELIGSNQAKAEATVDETADLFQKGQPQKASSYTDTYRVRYSLVLEKGRWLIKAMEVL